MDRKMHQRDTTCLTTCGSGCLRFLGFARLRLSVKHASRPPLLSLKLVVFRVRLQFDPAAFGKVRLGALTRGGGAGSVDSLVGLLPTRRRLLVPVG